MTTVHSSLNDSQQGYAPSSIQDCLRAGEKFGRWLQRQGHTVTGIDDAILDRYVSGLERHRSGKRCKNRCRSDSSIPVAATARCGDRTLQTKSPTPVDRWLARYDHYLEQVVGAAINTRERYRWKKRLSFIS